ncbi:MAG TPA: hypothetical protein VND45_16410, partial [Thermoanaerobaculia bacterium]|nr:hypothetical protein [Thermoanaerobaculia bacterium]
MTALLMLGIALYGLPLAWWARQRGFALAGASFLLGAGAITLQMFLLSAGGVAWTRTSVLVAIGPLLLITVWVARRTTTRRAEGGRRSTGTAGGAA